MNIILYKKISITSEAKKNRIFNSMPEKEGYIKSYMPFGKDGKGFYYTSKKWNLEKWKT